MDMAHKIPRRRKGGKEGENMENLKHVCRVCSRRFGCGKALGGHMRIHGGQLNAADESVHPQKKKKRKVSEIGGSESIFQQEWHEDNTVKEMPSSHSDPLRDIVGCSTSNSGSEEQVMHMHMHGDMNDLSSNPWMKGWRSKRPRYVLEQALSTNEDEDVANCLVMLSTAEGSWRPPETQLSEGQSKLGYYNYIYGSNDLKNACENKYTEKSDDSNREEEAYEWKISSRLYECLTCNKVFSSQRALCGHRASHKKAKGCCMEQQEQAKNKISDEVVSEESLHASCTNKPKVHECPICHRIFGSGQALGGHKRCHWITSPSPSHSPISSRPNQEQEQEQELEQKKEKEKERPVLLDLNLPAPVDDDEVDGLTPPNELSPMETHNNISSYAQQWWIDNRFKILSLPVNNKFEDKGNFKPEIHRPWLQVATKTA